MPFDQVLIFDIGSEYGHFRKYNTTTSPLTYSIPTRPAIIGLLGAIMGIEREIGPGRYIKSDGTVADVFSKENAGIAIQILDPIKKVSMAFNLLDTEKTGSSFFNIKQRTQIEFELIKHPFYRIFVKLEDKKVHDDLTERVQKNKPHFTPYLGLSQFTAILKFVTVAEIFPSKSSGSVPVITAVNLNNANSNDPIQFDRTSEFKYTSDTMPVAMQKDRVVTEYAEIIMETNGNPIITRSEHIMQVTGYGNILFL